MSFIDTFKKYLKADQYYSSMNGFTAQFEEDVLMHTVGATAIVNVNENLPYTDNDGAFFLRRISWGIYIIPQRKSKGRYWSEIQTAMNRVFGSSDLVYVNVGTKRVSVTAMPQDKPINLRKDITIFFFDNDGYGTIPELAQGNIADLSEDILEMVDEAEEIALDKIMELDKILFTG